MTKPNLTPSGITRSKPSSARPIESNNNLEVNKVPILLHLKSNNSYSYTSYTCLLNEYLTWDIIRVGKQLYQRLEDNIF